MHFLASGVLERVIPCSEWTREATGRIAKIRGKNTNWRRDEFARKEHRMSQMRRQMVRFLQKRKFRLVTRWKQALRKPGDLHRPEQLPIKNTLIFRAFDDVMREIKNPTENWSIDTTPDYAHVLIGEDTADPDQFAEVFLVGRTVLGDFITHDAAFSAQFDLTARMDLRTACDRVLVRFMERESCGHALRHAATNQQEGGA